MGRRNSGHEGSRNLERKSNKSIDIDTKVDKKIIQDVIREVVDEVSENKNIIDKDENTKSDSESTNKNSVLLSTLLDEYTKINIDDIPI